jgi:hypothetical protein
MANRFFISGGTNNNWSSTTNWSTTSGGAGGSSVPLVTDAAILDANSPACTLDTGSPTCASITCTGYTHTLTWNTPLTVAGAVTWGSGMTHAGTSDLIWTATSTLTANGVTMSGGINFQGSSQTFTLSGNAAISGNLTWSGTTAATVSTGAISVGGNLNIGTGSLGGTSVISLTGTSGSATWSGAGTLKNSLTFAGGANTITVSGTVNYFTSTITYTSGTVVTTGSTLSCVGGACTFNTAGITWNIIQIGGTTYTVNSLLSATAITMSGAGGNLAFAGTAGFSVGTFIYAALTASRTFTLKSGITYNVTTALILQGNITNALATFALSLVASTPGTQANLILATGATQFVGYTSATDINASGGQQIYSYQGSFSNSPNWTATRSSVGGVSRSRQCL